MAQAPAGLGNTYNLLLSSREGQAGLATLSFPSSWGWLCQGQPGGMGVAGAEIMGPLLPESTLEREGSLAG